jgi:hypothetical protein
MSQQLPTLSDKWHTVAHEIAFVMGENDKSLSVSTRFDGHGNAIVRFVIKTAKGETSYEKFDSAVGAYNMLP